MWERNLLFLLDLLTERDYSNAFYDNEYENK